MYVYIFEHIYEWFVVTTTLHLKSYLRLFNEVLAVAEKCDIVWYRTPIASPERLLAAMIN